MLHRHFPPGCGPLRSAYCRCSSSDFQLLLCTEKQWHAGSGSSPATCCGLLAAPGWLFGWLHNKGWLPGCGVPLLCPPTLVRRLGGGWCECAGGGRRSVRSLLQRRLRVGVAARIARNCQRCCCRCAGDLLLQVQSCPGLWWRYGRYEPHAGTCRHVQVHHHFRIHGHAAASEGGDHVPAVASPPVPCAIRNPRVVGTCTHVRMHGICHLGASCVGQEKGFGGGTTRLSGCAAWRLPASEVTTIVVRAPRPLLPPRRRTWGERHESQDREPDFLQADVATVCRNYSVRSLRQLPSAGGAFPRQTNLVHKPRVPPCNCMQPRACPFPLPMHRPGASRLR